MPSDLQVDNIKDGSATKTLAEYSSSAWSWGSGVPDGTVVQVKNYQFGSVINLGNVLIPYDDTIPQNTEGGEVMTLAITPLSTTNKLKIDILVNMSGSLSGEKMVVALFQDSTANALAVSCEELYDSNYMLAVPLTHFMTAGTTSSTTFKVRAGRTDSHGNEMAINGYAGLRKFGGVSVTSITITEIKDS